MNKRKVVLARLHQSVHLSGIGDLTTTVPPIGKNIEMEMSLTAEGVEIFFPKFKRYTLIPLANISMMELAAPAEPAKK